MDHEVGAPRPGKVQHGAGHRLGQDAREGPSPGHGRQPATRQSIALRDEGERGRKVRRPGHDMRQARIPRRGTQARAPDDHDVVPGVARGLGKGDERQEVAERRVCRERDPH